MNDSKRNNFVEAMPLSIAAVQAIYHAATGKTENLTKRKMKNYIIRMRDLEQMHTKIKQQIEHYKLIAGPTITINTKFNNHEQQQFSSWERFNIFDIGKTEITSEFVIKYEFIIQLPGSDVKQRYIITVDIDSRLPFCDKGDANDIDLELMIFANARIPALMISIDYIDYICAKNFCQTIKDWADSLEESKNSDLFQRILKSRHSWSPLIEHLSSIGAAIFIAIYAYASTKPILNFVFISYFIATVILIYTITSVFCSYINSLFMKSIRQSVVPAALILTIGDERAFTAASDRSKKTSSKFFKYIVSAIGSLLFNIISSFAYAWITRS